SVLQQLAQELPRVRVPDHRPGRHPQDQVRAVAARAVFPHPVLAALRAVVLLIPIVEKRAELPVGAQDDVATLPTVAACGTAPRHARLPPPRLRARAARTCVDVDHRVIDEHPHSILSRSAAARPSDDAPRPTLRARPPPARRAEPRTPPPTPLRPPPASLPR